MLEADTGRTADIGNSVERRGREHDTMAVIHGYEVVIVPGLHGSGPNHWQSRWERRHTKFRRVVQDDWTIPDLDTWSGRIEAEISKATLPVLIVAHSFGCLASIHGTRKRYTNVAGALLVAPADPGKFGLTEKLLSRELSFPSILIASANDPWMKAEHAAFWAGQWRSAFIDAGYLGHINADSDLGDWDFGLRQLKQLARLAALREGSRLPFPENTRVTFGDSCGRS